MEIPISEDGIIMIAAKLYGTDSSDYKVFRDAAEVRIKRREIYIHFSRLKESGDSYDDAVYQCSKKFQTSIGSVVRIISQKNIYDRHEEK